MAVLMGAMIVAGAAGLLAQTPKKQATYWMRCKVPGVPPGVHLLVYTDIAHGPSATTQDDGSYVLPGFIPGKFIVRVSESPYHITPSSRLVAIISSDVNGVDFQAQRILKPGSSKRGDGK
jgi:hypothetical protein